MTLSPRAPLKSSTLSTYTRAGRCCLFGTKEALSEKSMIMGQGACSPVFVKGWPLSQSPVGTNILPTLYSAHVHWVSPFYR